jgi:hypothetical protein
VGVRVRLAAGANAENYENYAFDSGGNPETAGTRRYESSAREPRNLNSKMRAQNFTVIH